MIGATAAGAATFRATKTGEGGPNSLRGAVQKANERDGDDTVILAPRQGSTFSLSACGPDGSEDDLNEDGDLDHIDADSKLTIVGRGNTIRNACVGERILHVAGGGDLTVSTVRLRDGDSLLSGGAIQAGNLVVRGSRLTGNDSVNAGGAINASAATISNSLISGNHSDADGGGVALSDGGRITSSVIRSNEAAGRGGGLFKAAGELTVSRSTFSGNRATSEGGGLFLDNAATTIRDSTVGGNTASVVGGGVRKFFGDLTITNTTISGNTGGDGSGIDISFDGATLRYATITRNSAYGIWTSNDPVNLTGSIVVSNADAECAAGTGSFNSGGHNIASDSSCGLTGEGDQPDTDLPLLPLRNNGGPTLTHALPNGSLAINRGGTSTCPETDQRGVPRPARCDVGAYERVRCRGAVVNRVGTPGPDTLRGTGGKDGILAFGGPDQLAGKSGKDGLCGGSGRDRLAGGGGRDKLDGQGGRDRCDGGAGNDSARRCEIEISIP